MQNAIREVTPIITDHAAVFGLLMAVLGVVFYTASLKNKYVQGFYAVIPPLLMCYFIPGILNSLHIIDGTNSPLAGIGSRYFLPACLILFTLNLDLRELWNLRKRAGLMFITGTIGIVLGGPIAVWLTALVAPDVVGGAGADEVWRGLGALAGSWIGGSANQVALREILQPSPQLFSSIIAVDALVAYIWMALLLYGASKVKAIDRFFKADASDVEALKARMDQQAQTHTRNPDTKDFIFMIALALGGTGLASLLSAPIAKYMEANYPQLEKFSLTNGFFWLILIATFIGIALSFTPARKLEHAGASKIGTTLLYMLIVTIGMQMDIAATLANPGLFVIGVIWMSFHALLLIAVAKIIKAPFFYLAVGSMANVGGVASATVTAAAFHPSLISVGVVLAVFGYAIGTYAGWFTAILMQMVSPI
ncbi:DUF819 domain-containing protein [Sphingobacterium deserti]|uniref:DUF819 family protein n=1 Tax=Sphingobacterium deserti TaxID=1229276 RepID=A0A0B8T335_9SPHI|nr:DUF819 family protein [Sphingobacterium deserti]KGE15857.1 hypothetical protein DI53_0410 [Sphingobacterium deserti]